MDDVIARLAAAPGIVANLVVEADALGLDNAPAGEWSARTLLAHLRDDEYLCMRPTLERMLAEDVPTVRFVDGSEWEPGRNRAFDRKDVLLAGFALQRQASVAILRMLRESDWQRRGRTGAGGDFTIARFVERWAEHDAEHISALERALGETYAEAITRRHHGQGVSEA